MSSPRNLDYSVRICLTLLLVLLLAGCGSGDELSGGNTGPSPSCSSNVSLPVEGGALDAGSNYQLLRFFVAGNNLCAISTDSGQSFQVASSLSPTAPRLTAYTGGISSKPLSIDGIIFPASDRLWFVSNNPVQNTPRPPEQISSESNGRQIDRLILGQDRVIAANRQIAYRRTLSGSGTTADSRWSAVRITDNATVPPAEFASNQRVLGPVNNDSGAFSGWLVHSFAPGSGIDELRFVPTGAVGQPGVLLQSGLGSLANEPVRYLTQLDAQQRGGGEVLLAVPRSGNTRYFRFFPGTEVLQLIGDLPGAPATVMATDGAALYLAQSVAGEARLYEISLDRNITQRDRANQGNTQPGFVSVTNQHVVWGWNSTSTETGPAQAIQLNKGDWTRRPLIVYDSNNRLRFSSPVRGSQNRWAFFNETALPGANGTPAPVANAIRVDTSNPAASPVRDENAAWQGQSQPGNAVIRPGLVAPDRISEVFQTRRRNNADQLWVFDAGAPDQFKVLLGEMTVAPLPAEQESMATPLSITLTEQGLGPYRLLLARNQLLVADTRSTNSLRTIIEDDTGSDLIRLFQGF